MRTVHDSCLIFKGISYSSSEQLAQADDVSNRFDTRETVRQIEDHNLKYIRTCGEPAQLPTVPEDLNKVR